MAEPGGIGNFVTDFADMSVLLPLSVCIGVGFALAGWPRGALAWTLAILWTMATVLALKLVFLGCGVRHGLSPSGHTAAGVAVYGGIAALWLRRRTGPGVATILAGGGVAGVIGASRVVVGAHTPLEVAIGGGVGLAAVHALIRTAGAPPAWVRGRWLLPVGILLVLGLHGVRLPAEARLRAFAGWLPRGACEAFGAGMK